MPTIHLHQAPWLSLQKIEKNGKIYIGITFVRMILLKPRTGHAIAAGNGVPGLLGLPCPPTPLSNPTEPIPPTRREGAVTDRRWEKGLAPKKTHQHTTSQACHCSKRNQSKPSNHTIVIKYCRHTRGLI
jgi:hypothetical protein